jgi:hypothetical protein
MSILTVTTETTETTEMAKLPATFTDDAVAVLDRLWVRAGELTTSEGARARMQADLSRKLHAGELSTVPLAHIIAMADQGHEPAQKALAEYIGAHIDAKRFDDLTPGLQDYNKRVLLRPELPGYRPGHKIIDTWTRDIVISFLVSRAMGAWYLKKKQAAALVAIVLKRRGIKPTSTRQVVDIYDSRGTIGQRVVAFMMEAIPEDAGGILPPASAV